MYPVIPEHNAVRFRHAVLFGLPECGKTTMFQWLAWKAISTYGRANINLIPVRSLNDGITRMDSKPVQILFVDDSIRSANSRKSMSQAEDIADFYEIRHIFEKTASTKKGIVITWYAAQRFKSLDIVFRNAQALIFKSIPVDPNDQKEVMSYMGNKPYGRLSQITRQIYEQGNDQAKSECIVCLPFSHRSGTAKYPMTDNVLDFDPPTTATNAPFNIDIGQIIEKYKLDRAWRRPALAYYLNRFENQTQDQIAKEPKIKCEQAQVSNLIKQMIGELSRANGSAWESWKAHDLETKGWTVKHNGLTSMPDIIASKDGRTIVYSCKCLDFNREIKLPIIELRPEIGAALKLSCPLILSIYNIAEQGEQEVILDASKLGREIVIKPRRY
jgi:hypothetical protein